MATRPASPAHTWRFFRAGGFDQVRLDRGADLLDLGQLDQKLWVALACPTAGLEFDDRTLALIDTDHDGRVRAPELLAAIKWTGSLLKNPDDLFKGTASLPLDAINDATAEGQAILESARQVLVNLGKPEANDIRVSDLTDTAKIFAQTAFNGDGLIVADSAEDEPTRTLIADIIHCLGSDLDRSGKPGINQAKVDAFFADATALVAWADQAQTDAATLLPLGEATAAAADALAAVKAKVDDYFGRCRLAAYDARALAALNREEKEYLALAARDLTISAAEVADFPLAPVAAGKPLPLRAGVNPAWADRLATLQAAAVKPLLGERAELTEADWSTLGAKLGPYQAWTTAKPATQLEPLGLERVRSLLAEKGQETLGALIVRDQAQEANVKAITTVEKLVRFHRDLALLCTNFVNFKDFYSGSAPAIFQAGTLYLDQRSCDLCLRVDDAAKHAAMAALAGSYLAYCDCVRKGTGEKLQIVAAFTDGDSDNLMVGRNGIFYDRKGRDWDATITRIIDNPISLRQAFWSPYKKFVRLIEELVAKRAAAAETASSAKLEGAATAVAHADTAKPPAAAPPKKLDIGSVAAIGIAFGAIGTFFATLLGYVTGIIRFGPPAIIGAVLAVIALISGPSLILAFLKLRKRNLGPLLDANGWAVNARARINVPFGKSLTGIAKLPPGSHRDLRDPYREKRQPWGLYITLFVLLFAAWSWYQGKIDTYLPSKITSISVLGTNAPASKVEAPKPPAP